MWGIRCQTRCSVWLPDVIAQDVSPPEFLASTTLDQGTACRLSCLLKGEASALVGCATLRGSRCRFPDGTSLDFGTRSVSSRTQLARPVHGHRGSSTDNGKFHRHGDGRQHDRDAPQGNTEQCARADRHWPMPNDSGSWNPWPEDKETVNEAAREAELGSKLGRSGRWRHQRE